MKFKKILIKLIKKNTFLWFLDFFLGEKFILNYVINAKSQILHAKIFMRNQIFDHKSKLQTKKGLNIFYLKFVFLLMKNCISEN